MNQYGKIIARLRREQNMTQAELGAKLNVTYQAVSKWENDQSQPDFSTMVQIAELFHVPLTIFLTGEEAESAETAAAESDPVIGYCTVCGNSVRKSNIAQSRPTLICMDCVEEERKKRAREIVQSEERAKQFKQHRFEEYRNSCKHALHTGLFFGGVIAGIALIISVLSVALVENMSIGWKVAVVGLITLFTFTYVTQLPWKRFALNVTLAMFEPSGNGWGGIGFIESLIACLTLPIFALFAIALSPFSFIPSLIMLFRNGPDDAYKKDAAMWRMEQEIRQRDEENEKKGRS